MNYEKNDRKIDQKSFPVKRMGKTIYDEIRTLIKNGSKKISVAECICKKAKDQVNEPCRITDRRELCLYLGDFHDTFSRKTDVWDAVFAYLHVKQKP